MNQHLKWIYVIDVLLELDRQKTLDVNPMLVNRLRRWTNINTTLGQRVVCVGGRIQVGL